MTDVFRSPRQSSAMRALDEAFMDRVRALYAAQCVTEPPDPAQFRQGLAKALVVYDDAHRAITDVLT